MKQRKVDFENNIVDQQVLILTDMGLYGRVIAERTKMTLGKVRYRYQRGGMSPLAYREGRSVTARHLLAAIESPEFEGLRRQILRRIR